MTVLSLGGVTKRFDDNAGVRTVLDRVDLDLADGEIVTVIGRSGSGKTTLLLIAAGLEPADDGEVTTSPAVPWRSLALVPQSLGLLAELTVAENVVLPLRLGEIPRAADPDAVMARLGVSGLAGRYPNEISLGEQQRTALARAAVVQPEVLIADEPVAHQNRAWAEEIMALLVDLAAAGSAVLLATHDEIAMRHSHRVLELRDGRLHLVSGDGDGGQEPPRGSALRR